MNKRFNLSLIGIYIGLTLIFLGVFTPLSIIVCCVAGIGIIIISVMNPVYIYGDIFETNFVISIVLIITGLIAIIIGLLTPLNAIALGVSGLLVMLIGFKRAKKISDSYASKYDEKNCT